MKIETLATTALIGWVIVMGAILAHAIVEALCR
jgi:hypothetical protein